MVASLSELLALMRHHGADRVYAKKLAPNDNSKNQVYLGGGFGALNIIPHGEIVTDTSQIAGSKQDRPKAKVKFYWVDSDGKHLAPDAQLILYPDYPEVRMSGFLKGCKQAPSEIMTVRDAGRILFMGMTKAGDVIGYATPVLHPVTAEFNAGKWESIGVFYEMPLATEQKATSKNILLGELRRIYHLHWIASHRLSKGGVKVPYSAPNGGGYTLEAELGIIPNGIAEPDFMGWEIKQYGVKDFDKFASSSPVTLMTPEPTGGYYKTEGPEAFLHRYGYPDKKGKPDRLNFGGIYTCQKDFHPDTGLRMTMKGFNVSDGTIDLTGGIMLVDRDDDLAASWSFTGLMKHWNRKHAQAAYVPSLFRKPPPEYAYGSRVLLCEQTDFLLFLKAFTTGTVYYDPAVKLEDATSSKPKLKRRSQFRVKHQQVTGMYHTHEEVDLLTT